MIKMKYNYLDNDPNINGYKVMYNSPRSIDYKMKYYDPDEDSYYESNSESVKTIKKGIISSTGIQTFLGKNMDVSDCYILINYDTGYEFFSRMLAFDISTQSQELKEYHEKICRYEDENSEKLIIDNTMLVREPAEEEKFKLLMSDDLVFASVRSLGPSSISRVLTKIKDNRLYNKIEHYEVIWEKAYKYGLLYANEKNLDRLIKSLLSDYDIMYLHDKYVQIKNDIDNNINGSVPYTIDELNKLIDYTEYLRFGRRRMSVMSDFNDRNNYESKELFEYPAPSAKKAILDSINENPFAFRDLSSNWKNDKEVVLEAVRKNGMLLEYASDAMKEDKEVVLEAMKNDRWSLRFASEKLLGNKEFIKEAMTIDYEAMYHAIEDVRLDAEMLDLFYMYENRAQNKNSNEFHR